MQATIDGKTYDEPGLAILIGDSMPSEEDRLAALSLLREAITAGCTSAFLWKLAGAAVWDGLGYAREMLSAPQEPAQRIVGAPARIHAPAQHDMF